MSQQHVFEIEFADGAESYEGGSNKEIVHEDQASLVNPIPDFVTYARWGPGGWFLLSSSTLILCLILIGEITYYSLF